MIDTVYSYFSEGHMLRRIIPAILFVLSLQMRNSFISRGFRKTVA